MFLKKLIKLLKKNWTHFDFFYSKRVIFQVALKHGQLFYLDMVGGEIVFLLFGDISGVTCSLILSPIARTCFSCITVKK